MPYEINVQEILKEYFFTERYGEEHGYVQWGNNNHQSAKN